MLRALVLFIALALASPSVAGAATDRYSGSVKVNGRTVATTITVKSGKVSSDLFVTCGRDGNFAGSPHRAKLLANGNFTAHYHYRNPQSGIVIDSYFKGAIAGDQVNATFRLVISHAKGHNCKSPLVRLRLKKVSGTTAPKYPEGNYRMSIVGGTGDVTFVVSGDQIHDFHLGTVLTCRDGSTFDYEVRLDVMPISATGRSEKTVDRPGQEHDELVVDLGRDEANGTATGSVLNANGSSCFIQLQFQGAAVGR